MKPIAKAIAEICKDTHVPMAHAVFGDAGVEAVFQVMDAVSQLYKFVEPERIPGTVLIFKVVVPQPNADPVGPTADFAGLGNSVLSDLIIEIASDGQPYQRTVDPANASELAKTSVVYRAMKGAEEFLAGDRRKPVLKLDPSARSQFSVPTFSSLRKALQAYAYDNVRESTCYILGNIWADDNRLFLKAKPEEIIRNSLTQFLRNRLGADHEVWPEQNVDESHPVDIQVKPKFSNNRLMLIEVKWLGLSIAEDGHITVNYSNARAQEGANQLAQYLNDKLAFAPTNVIQGYLVILDARRKGVKEGDKTISLESGMFFENKELTFAPAQHELRKDFDPPYRMFARPICVHA
jgi:hypothetical protein